MSESYKKWIKQKLEKLQAIDCYSAGATPETVAKQLGVTTKQIIKLDFNENLFMPRVKQAKLLKELSLRKSICVCTPRMRRVNCARKSPAT
jgi:hypothetical protein